MGKSARRKESGREACGAALEGGVLSVDSAALEAGKDEDSGCCTALEGGSDVRLLSMVSTLLEDGKDAGAAACCAEIAGAHAAKHSASTPAARHSLCFLIHTPHRFFRQAHSPPSLESAALGCAGRAGGFFCLIIKHRRQNV